MYAIVLLYADGRLECFGIFCMCLHNGNPKFDEVSISIESLNMYKENSCFVHHHVFTQLYILNTNVYLIHLLNDGPFL
jgi:hypothetical protein